LCFWFVRRLFTWDTSSYWCRSPKWRDHDAAMPAFYHRPSSLEDVIDQTINRTLDMLGIELEHDLSPRWQGPLEKDRLTKSRCRSVVSD
jgi:hypothetical protein